MPSRPALPEDFAVALRAAPDARAAWDRLAPGHQREHLEAIEGAKRADTRARRIAKAVEMLAGGAKRPVTASTKSLAAKLLAKPGQAVIVLNAPEDPGSLLGAMPEGATLRTRLGKTPPGTLLLFVRNSADLSKRLPAALDVVGAATTLWIAYPKRTGSEKSDLNRDTLNVLMREHEWIGVAQVAVNAGWSASRFRPGRMADS